jgi:hypothetical protein
MRRVTTWKAWMGAALAVIAAVGADLKAEHGKLSLSDIPVLIGAAVAGYQGVYWTKRDKEVKT